MQRMDIYQRLARHLDDLPGGFPATDSGVELRILRRLFTPQEAELALHLTLISEEPRVIARRAGIPLEEAGTRLKEMAAKGLIYSLHPQSGPPRYRASQYMVGIWEYQVNRLSPELIRDMDEYVSVLMDMGVWRRAPQLRTIPVQESVDGELAVMAYEQAGELVRAQERVGVANCICRQVSTMIGEGCERPQQTCLSFGESADYMVHHGVARATDRAEALDILALADEAALVLQPSNSREASFICACCGCCCGVLQQIRSYPQPARLVSTPFNATLSGGICRGCGLCVKRCQMGALRLVEKKAHLDHDRCIGCGLCVTTCPSHALSLARKPDGEQPRVPRTFPLAILQLGRVRGKLGAPRLAGMLARSGMDRLLARR